VQISPELIQRFLENKCDAEDRAAVLQYLKDHSDAMEIFFPWKDWEHTNETRVPVPVSDEMLQTLTQQLFSKKPKVVWLRIRQVAAAAAIFILVTATAVLYILNKEKGATANAVVTAGQPVLKKDTLWVSRENHTKKIVAILLPDGSTVRLKRNAVLKYQSVYGEKKRDVWLEGQAFFQVAKQKEKPFTVCTRLVNTTALGTSFTVQIADMNASVQLHTGKVVVKPVKDLPGFKKEIYLSPGEKISYDYIQSMVKVIRNTDKRIDKTSASNKLQDLEYNNEALTTVMAQLSARYHQTIHFNPDELTGMNFTGTVARNDSLNVILRLIANMNNLTVEENGNSFTISKNR
jgi:transmembrane sensor